jgi:hypothetical protein
MQRTGFLAPKFEIPGKKIPILGKFKDLNVLNGGQPSCFTFNTQASDGNSADEL